MLRLFVGSVSLVASRAWADDGPPIFQGTITPSAAAHVRFAGCPGFIAGVPTATLEIPAGGESRSLRVRSVGDTVVVLRRSSGRYACADDEVGVDPVIDGPFAPGTLEIWVGSFRRVPNDVTVTWEAPGESVEEPAPRVADRQPDREHEEDVSTFTFRPPPEPEWHVVGSGTAGGDAQDPLHGGCPGWFSRAGATEIRLDRAPAAGTRLRARTEGGDTTLSVIAPNGTVLCADDDYGLDPAVTLPELAGTYRVLVGTYTQGDSIRYELVTGVDAGYVPVPPLLLDSTDLGPPVAIAEGPPEGGQLLASVNAGGPTTASAVDTACNGFVPTAPQFRWNNTRTSHGRLRIVGNGGDTTLLVRYPDGSVHCNDDSVGLDPELSGEFARGRYEIFVGTYEGSRSIPVDLYWVDGEGP